MHHRTSHRSRTAVLAVLLAPLLTLGLAPGGAQADVHDRDPERVGVARQTPHQDTDRVAAGRTSAALAPATIDSDLYAYTVSPAGRTYFAVAGHLRLKLRSGSSTKYSGSFVDYDGGSSTKASADASKPEAPTVSLKSRYGDLTFRGDSTFGGSFYTAGATKVPSKLGKAKDVHLAASEHSVKTTTWTILVSQRTGPVNRPTEYNGTLTLAYDANFRVSGGQVTVTDRKGRNVTHAIKGTGFYGGTYFYATAKVDTVSMGMTATVSGTSFSGFGFAGSGRSSTQWVVSGNQ